MNKVIIAISVFIFSPTLSYAHIMGIGGDFMSGLSHPVLGFDHLLAMISVGILSAQMGGRAIWLVPTTFVLVMLMGGLMGMAGIPLFSVETGIALSVFAMGLALAIEKKLPSYLCMLFVGFFAIFHGHAHGAEMPSTIKPLLYFFGFFSGTAIIHISGVVVGLLFEKTHQGKDMLRFTGAGIAGIGLHLLVI